jgi:hypothetical protein
MRTVHAGFKSGKNGFAPTELLAQLGPTFLVDVGSKNRSRAGGTPDLQHKGVRALIDTGAGAHAIDETFAIEIGLQSNDKGTLSGVMGEASVNIYTARVYVPGFDLLLFEPFYGVKLKEGGQWHRVVLGRPFLRGYTMIYEGRSGQVTIHDGE